MGNRGLAALLAQFVLIILWWQPARGQQYLTGTPLLSPQDGPFEPVKALKDGLGIHLEGLPDDRVFFADVNIGKRCRAQGSITIELPVTRYVGERGPEDFLVYPSGMIERGFLSPTATLVVAAFDIDSGGAGPTWDLDRPVWLEVVHPEEDPVRVNGKKPLGSDFNNPTLLGEDGKWSLTAFDIDIRNVKFPNRGANGNEPTPAVNTITIDIDTGYHPVPLMCIGGIDWVALHIKTVSPMILIHGNGSDPSFFAKRGFVNQLADAQWPLEGCSEGTRGCLSPVELDTGPIRANANKLAELIPKIARSMGVNSVHLVAHSKGGLDAREYLAREQPSFDQDFTVLSYTSLATPHNGTPGADANVALHNATTKLQYIDWENFSLAEITGIREDIYNSGREELTTQRLRGFNVDNLQRLKSLVRPVPTDDDKVVRFWNLMAADAASRVNETNQIDDVSEWLSIAEDADEGTLLKSSAVPNFVKQIGMNEVYNFLGRTAMVVVEPNGFTIPSQGSSGSLRVYERVKLVRVDAAAHLNNDLAVQVDSGLGAGSVELLPNSYFSLRYRTLFEFESRNHSNIVDTESAEMVMFMVLQAEQADPRGDLR